MLLWLDLETTGLDPQTDQVLEVGAILTTDTLVEERRLHIVVGFSGELSGAVQQMHDRNGLLAACQRSALTEQEAGWLLSDWLMGLMNVIGTQEKVTLAGSGVAHFDLPWLKVKWPEVADLLSFYVLDVGILRRGNRLAGVRMPVVPESSTENKRHRAMDDVEAHLTEMRLFKDSQEIRALEEGS